MNTVTKKIGLKQIVIKWSEGLPTNRMPITVDSWAEATKVLQEISHNNQTVDEKYLPSEDCTGYHKTGFVVTFTDGEIYEGRCDVQWGKDDNDTDIALHIFDHCRIYSGLHRPSHIEEEHYRELLTATEKATPGYIEWSSKILKVYDLDGYNDNHKVEINPAEVLSEKYHDCFVGTIDKNPKRSWALIKHECGETAKVVITVESEIIYCPKCGTIEVRKCG